jgi:outer membrane biosynthesis protein TonB
MKVFAFTRLPLLLVTLCLGLPATQATEGAAEIAEFSALIHDFDRFAASLPKTVLINASPTEVARPEFNRALARLKRHGQSEVFVFPDAQSPARPMNILPPVYPAALREQNIPGEAYLLGLIGPDGTVRGIFVAGATHKEFAISAALAFGRWEFQPAAVNGTAVPVLVVQVLAFKAVPATETD